MQLTQEQLTAINHNERHARIIAVAGAGKTATLSHYLAKRIKDGNNPKRILVLMYNKAVKDAFEQRLQQLSLPQTPTIRTFHSLGLKLYQGLITQGHLPPSTLNPLPNHVIELQIKQLLQNSDKGNPLLQSNEALQEWVETSKNFIQFVKCTLNGPEHTFETLEMGDEKKFLIDIFHEFEQWRKDNRAITYDDMLYDPAKIFEAEPESQRPFKDIMDEILVDEYQDINPIQHFLLKAISGERAKVIVIGDPDQTIYEFRGSSPDFINRAFANDFKNPKKYSLSQTFRFGHQLALAANHLICNNQDRDAILTISADTTPETKIHLSQTSDHGNKIASAIEALSHNGAPYAGMAVLCRLWSFARPVELALMARGIPYLIEGEESIFKCWELRPLMHLLQMLSGDFFNLNNGQKCERLFDILSIPSPKIPHKILQGIAQNWADIINDSNFHSSLHKAFTKGLTPYQTKTLKNLAQALKVLKSKANCSVLMSKYANKIDYYQKLKDTSLSPTKGNEQAGTVSAFIRFLQTLQNKTPAEVISTLNDMQGNALTRTHDTVTLTTIHRSKGREWPAVFIPDLTEGHIPYFSSANDGANIDTLEAERRLMYVAITRAQKHLFLSTSLPLVNSAKTGDDEQAEPSRFIKEMELSVCQQISLAIQSKKNSLECDHHNSAISEQYLAKLGHDLQITLLPATSQTNTPDNKRPTPTDTSQLWSKGDRIKHTVLGLGEVVKLENEKIIIRFDSGGSRAFVGKLVQPHLSLSKGV